MSSASFLHSSFLQAISALMLWPVHVQKVPQELHRFNDSANKISSNKCDFNSVKLNSRAVPSYQVARNMTLAHDQHSMCCT